MPFSSAAGRRLLTVAFMFFGVVGAASSGNADTLTVAWDRSTDSTVTGYVVYVQSQSGGFAQTYDVGNVISYPFTNAAPGETYYFTVAAYNAEMVGPMSIMVSGSTTNAAPVVTNPGNRTTTVGQATGLQITASDPDGSSLTFSASGLPPGLMLTTSTGYISGTSTTAGTYTVKVNASDGILTTSVTFTWTVSGQTATAPILVSPSGSLATSTPKFVWNAAKGATSYLLVADDSKTAGKIRTTVSASAAGCATTTVCSLSPGVVLATGSARWVVETLTSTGDGPWSAPMTFAVGDSSAPILTITAPVKAGMTYEDDHANVALAGTASDNIGVTAVTWTNSRGGSGTATGTSSWAANVGLSAGINVLSITARDAVGNKTTSAITVIRVVPPTPLSPTKIGSATPTFSWTAVAAATKYILKVKDGAQNVKALVGIRPFDAGCETTSICSLKPSILLAAGAAYWSVETIVMTDVNAWSPTIPFTVDPTAPSVTMAAPTRSSTYWTTNSSVALSGVAADNIALSKVVWMDSTGRSGVASGTSQWSLGWLPLVSGTTTFTITAIDMAGNKTSTKLAVTRTQ